MKACSNMLDVKVTWYENVHYIAIKRDGENINLISYGMVNFKGQVWTSILFRLQGHFNTLLRVLRFITWDFHIIHNLTLVIYVCVCVISIIFPLLHGLFHNIS